MESISTTPNVISVAGSDDALASLEEENNTISIPASVADISGKNSDYEDKINISDYLPDGVKLTSDSSEDVFVRVNILPKGSNVCEVPTKNIKVNNSPEGMQVAFEEMRFCIPRKSKVCVKGCKSVSYTHLPPAVGKTRSKSLLLKRNIRFLLLLSIL